MSIIANVAGHQLHGGCINEFLKGPKAQLYIKCIRHCVVSDVGKKTT